MTTRTSSPPPRAKDSHDDAYPYRRPHRRVRRAVRHLVHRRADRDRRRGDLKLAAILADGTRASAQQRPHLAVVCTAGLVAEHDMAIDYGIDLDDLDAQHSLTLDPDVVRLRTAAQLLGEDLWIAVKLPGQYDGDDDLPDGTVARRWTTVALYPDELGWLREALALNAVGEQDLDDEDDDPDPL